jgi:hypothetical protein
MFGRNRAVSAGSGLHRTHESEVGSVRVRSHRARKSGTAERRLPGSPGILTILLGAEYKLAKVPNRLQSP